MTAPDTTIRQRTACTAPTMPARPGRIRGAGDDGTVTAFVVIMMLALLLFAGLVLDGGLTLAAKVQAIDEAQAAARAGAGQINLTAYRTGGHEVLDQAAASRAARAYLVATGHTGTVQVAGDQVTVTVHITQRTQILGIAGIHALSVTGTGSARPEQAPVPPAGGGGP